MKKYDSSSIQRLTGVEHIRANPSMYIGDTSSPTQLVTEIVDNSLDEVVNGGATIVAVIIDTTTGACSVADNGRGIPADPSKSDTDDPLVMVFTDLFTSGKFKKSSGDAYGVAIGLHGIGLSTCAALSDFVVAEVFRDKQKYHYTFNHDGKIERKHEPYTGKIPFSTRVTIKPHSSYFQTVTIDATVIEHRLALASAMYPQLRAALVVDGKKSIFDCTLDDIIKKYLHDCENWIEFSDTQSSEHYKIRLAWDTAGSNAQQTFGVVNLCRVDEGAHILKVTTALKQYFSEQGSKRKLVFNDSDCLVGLRAYIECGLIKPHFQAQIKTKLAADSDLSIFDSLPKQIEIYFNKNKTRLEELLSQFAEYRQSLQHKRTVQDRGGKRGSTKFTKLRDCTQPGGELIIGEGDSAVGGLSTVRNPAKHAILPLRGVIPNTITKRDFYKNKELADIIEACGTGILKQCDVSKLRYSKILLCADADAAGEWITSLLIILFANAMPEIIKTGKLFVCRTPLYGTRIKSKFHPIWTEEELEKLRSAKGTDHIFRFKGLGEINPPDLATLILDESSRKLIQVKWSSNPDALFELLSSSEEKRKLVMGEWTMV